jgi:hypothetical protein
VILPPPLRKAVTLPPRRALRNRDAERLRLALLWQSYPPEPVEPEWCRVAWTLAIYCAAVLFLLGLLTSCGAPPTSSDAPDSSAEPTEPSPPQGVLVFAAAPDLFTWAEDAAERWSAATGTDIRVGELGLLVASATGLTTSDGRRAAGGTLRDDAMRCTGVAIDSEFGGPRTTAHEMGCHCLAGPGHSDSGLCSSHGSDLIDEASLAKVCAVWPCTAFAPEAP